MTEAKKKVLFVCTGNAGRSQIAEILFSKMAGPGFDCCSGGVAPWPHLHPSAVKLLSARGIDTAGRKPKHAREFIDAGLSWVVTIGDRALAEIPRFRGNPTLIHWDISDPADADGTGREDEAFAQATAMIEERLPGLREIVKTGACAREMHLEPGISTCIVRPDRFDPAKHLPAFAAARFRCIELNCFIGSDDFPWDRAHKVKELRKVAEDTGVRICSVHAEGGIGACRGARSERMAIDMYRIFADLAAELGATMVTLHAELPQGVERLQALAQLRASAEILASHVRDMPCAFGWENLPSHPVKGISASEALSLIRDLGQNGFAFVLDTGHSNLNKTTDAWLAGCDNMLLGLHLNNNDGSGDQHKATLPTTGTVQWQGFVDRLLRNGYAGPLMLEIVGTGGRTLEAALNEALEGVKFLKSAECQPGACCEINR